MNIEELDKLENEIWKFHPIGIYGSNKGRCYLPKSGTQLAHYSYGSNRGNGYKQIRWKRQTYNIHRLIAELFIPNPNNLPTVDHMNRNRSDNRVENLRWANMSMQINNRSKYKRPNTPKNNAKSKQVMQIVPSTNEIIRIWESTRECGRNGFNHRCISACCRNKYSTKNLNIYKGYKWQYVA